MLPFMKYKQTDYTIPCTLTICYRCLHTGAITGHCVGHALNLCSSCCCSLTQAASNARGYTILLSISSCRQQASSSSWHYRLLLNAKG